MPRVRPTPGPALTAARRRAIEEHLTPAERAALDTLTTSLGVPADRWFGVRSLRDAFGLLAWRREVARRVGDGAGITRAQREAGLALGLDGEALRSAWRRMARTIVRSD